MKKLLLLSALFIWYNVTAQNVGIGITAPQATLDVRGNHRLGGLTRYITHDSATGRIEWRSSNLYVPVTQFLMKHSAAGDGLYYNNTMPVSGQLEYRNASGNPVFFTNFTNGEGYFSGNLGVGTTTPGSKLHVRYGPSGYTGGVYHPGAVIEGDGNAYLQFLAPDAPWETGVLFGKASDPVSGGIVYNNSLNPDGLHFRTAGNLTRMTINQAGNVGIGTAFPEATLHVASGSSGYSGPQFPGAVIEGSDNTYLNILSPNNKESSILFGKVSDLASGGIVYNNSTLLNGFQFRTNGNQTRMVINSVGNVGIGASAPQFPLHFASTLGDKIALWGSFGAHYGLGVASNMLMIHTDIAASDIAFGYGGWGFFNEKMRIKGNGNVGIGTSSPTEKLDVSGNVKASTYKYTSPKLYYYSIPAIDFQSEFSADAIVTQVHQAFYNSTNVLGRLYAPVNLPHGALLNSMTVYYQDDSPTVELRVRLQSQTNGNPFDGGNIHATVTTAAITGNANTTVSNLVSTINNASQYYFIEAQSEIGGSRVAWPGSQLVVRSVVISYTLSEAQ